MENNMIGCKCSHLVEDGAKQGYNCFLYLCHHRQRLPTLWESKVTNVHVCVVLSLTGGEQGKTNCHSTVQRWRRSRGAHLEQSLLLWLENFISFFLHPNTDVFTFSCGIWRSRHVWFLRSCLWRYCFVFIFNTDLSPRVLRFALCCFRETEIKHLPCLVLQLTSIIVFILKIACKFDPSQMSEINTALK